MTFLIIDIILVSMDDLTIERPFIGQIGSRLEQFKTVRKDVWVARCPICGDSKKKKFLKRFYIYKKDNKYSVKCHNCGHASTFHQFLEDYHNDLYREYQLEKFPQKSKLSKSRFSHVKDVIPKKVVCTGFDYSSLIWFEELPEDHPARIYVEKRKIPFELVHYAPKFSKFIEELDMDRYTLSYRNSHEPRMIIPFFREDGLSTVFQARAFSKTESLRYITIKEHDDESKVYGMERVDKEKPVWCSEGPIDSMMIPNCIAMSGISTALPKGISEFRFVFDNEPRQPDVIKNMRKRLRSGHKVVIFPEMVTQKDLNDMVVSGMSSEKILDMLENNLYDKEIGLLKLKEWSKT